MFGIYWDCDGTLMDTQNAFAYAWQEVLKSKKLDLPIDHFDQYVGVDDKIVHEKFSSEVESRASAVRVSTIFNRCAPFAA